jgi:putative heme-binding domain-containing protein
MPKFPVRVLLLNGLLVSIASALADSVPADLEMKRFSGPDITPCPACLCVSVKGEVFAGVDLNGSLGKGPGKGRVVKLVDRDHDGVADVHTEFAKIDNPRGLIALGTRLYVLHTAHGPDGKSTGMDLVVLTDANQDGVADGPAKVLVKGVCQAKAVNDRGTDHSTNGIRMGIDGWIYIAVGDFGFADATGTDGRKLTLLGGGVVRVRPDGTELELYTGGTRNIYDVAIDPFLNIFTRGNTNDGGGWNVRFLHHIQSAEFGYPRLFKNFSSEILPALEDLGGGSGTGSLFLSEPTWPAAYNDQPLMCDWGRQIVYLHRLTPDGASFTQKAEEFIKVAQVTDLDVDPSGALYAGAWEGAGFKGDVRKGYIVRVTPKGWTHKATPDLAVAKTSELVRLLASPSASLRLFAQQEILVRPDAASVKPLLLTGVKNTTLSPAARVAVLFTLAQIETDPKELLALASDSVLREFALRAAADRLPRLKNSTLPLEPCTSALKSGTPREQAAAAVALGRLGNPAGAPALLAVAFQKPPPEDPADIPKDVKPKDKNKAVNTGKVPRHATPNSAIVVPHLAFQALVRLGAVEPCLQAIGTPSEDLALWALSGLHEENAVDGLLAKWKATPETGRQEKIITVLARLYQREAEYKGDWWWSTRPDTRGPYYKPVPWSASPRIAAALEADAKAGTPERKEFLAKLNESHRLNLTALGKPAAAKPAEAIPTVDLAKIAAQKGAVGTTPIEDVILSLAKLKPNHARGEALFTQQGCVACHALKPGGPALGPFMGQIGGIMNAEQIATAILRPNDTISQGFQSTQVTLKNGGVLMGFITESNVDQITLRDMTGKVTVVPAKDVAKNAPLPMSMMPEGLANALSLEDFAAMVHFLAGQK